MAEIQIDPFEQLRKNAHIWKGDNAIISYNEPLRGGFFLMILYELGGEKRFLKLEASEKHTEIQFENKTVSPDLWEHLVKELDTWGQITQSKPQKEKSK